jgi:CheY-like chemotaxis protein
MDIVYIGAGVAVIAVAAFLIAKRSKEGAEVVGGDAAPVRTGDRPVEKRMIDEKEGIEKEHFRKFAGMRVLLAEDNAINRKIVAGILEGSGIVLEFAEDGAEAVRKCIDGAGDSFDMVLMDIEMPRMDGNEATVKIRENGATATIPIVALSSSTAEEEVEKMFSCGMDGYIPKPLSLGRLYGAFETFSGGRS